MANPFANKAASLGETVTLVREAVADNAIGDSYIEGPHPEVIESSPDDSINDTADRITGHAKLSQLVDNDFPFDESQLDAIDGIGTEQYACLTGAAGTGKTTTTKAIVDKLLEGTNFDSVNMETYWKAGSQGADADDDYEAPKSLVPSVAMCAYTGRATQMIKKNFPRDWHGNIMTIHRLLGFVPQFDEVWDDESGGYRKKMKFVPSYDADFLLPWDTILIDEAGMLGIDLWEQLWAACKPGCRIIMIGDINQLPPVHGKSVFGFAMSQWPSWELTKVHRQQGVNNPIVDNAWRILNGRRPESEGRFQMIELKGDASEANRRVRKMLNALQERTIYDPIRDTVITPINGEDGSRGFQLGQLPLNRDLAIQFNPQSEHPRFIIDGGRERKQFAVGDKVMATKNDWEAGITNGMTGVITSIEDNAGYAGDRRIFGDVNEVTAYLRETGDEAREVLNFSLEDLESSMDLIDEGQKAGKEKKDRGPASHIVTVRFGDAEHGIEVPFGSLSEVGSLMIAYVVTCHKMQGGESPVVIIICHGAHRAMLYREWLYTAVTRASEKCILLYSEDALKSTLNKQKMPGSTLKQKVQSFNAAQDRGDTRIPTLPFSHSQRNRVLDRTDLAVVTPAHLVSQDERKGGLMSLMGKRKEVAPAPKPEPETVRVVHEHRFTFKVVADREPVSSPKQVDGGDLKNETQYERINREFKAVHSRLPLMIEVQGIIMDESRPAPKALPAPPKLVSQWGAAQVQQAIGEVMENSKFLLTHQPAVVTPTVRKFGVK